MKRTASAAGASKEEEVRVVLPKRAKADEVGPGELQGGHYQGSIFPSGKRFICRFRINKLPVWETFDTEEEADAWRRTQHEVLGLEIKNRWRNLPDGTIEMMLTKGATTIFDQEDLNKVESHIWGLSSHGYAVSQGKYLHSYLMQTPKKMYTDHINRIKTDNRRANLRIVTQKQNMRNAAMYSSNTSGYANLREEGTFSCTFFDGTRSRQVHASYTGRKKSARRAARQRLVTKRGSFLMKDGSVPCITKTKHWAVSMMTHSSEKVQKTFPFPPGNSRARQVAFDEALAFRDAQESFFGSTNGKPAAKT